MVLKIHQIVVSCFHLVDVDMLADKTTYEFVIKNYVNEQGLNLNPIHIMGKVNL